MLLAAADVLVHAVHALDDRLAGRAIDASTRLFTPRSAPVITSTVSPLRINILVFSRQSSVSVTSLN